MKARKSFSSAKFHNPLRIATLIGCACQTAHSQIVYSSDFEALNAGSSTALTDNSWMAYANVYNSSGVFLYGYASTPPNGGNGFWAVTTNQAGSQQGIQGLSVYGDYYNQSAQTAGNLVEANVFQQFVIFSEDAGSYAFRFDTKAGNLQSPSKAQAFIKVLDPSNNYATVASSTLDTSTLPGNWGTYSIRLNLEESMDGMILQIGFSATSSYNVASGVFYDNLSFGIAPPEPPVVTAITKSENLVSVTFPTETGFSYHLVKSTDGMTTFDPVLTQPSISGDGTPKVATDNAAIEPSAFYRIGRQAQP
jgi:hypothetical protein